MSKQFIPMLLSTAAIASTLVIPVAVNAQSSPQSIVCHVTIPLQANRQGSVPKLTYRLTGTLPQPTAEMPQKPVGNVVQIYGTAA
ncbi:MAG: hypothetical protein HC805_07905 [Alkalinema sp. RL_2_19]|nr:hypothetical protein [Alkalinema sp. RL_2_19]